MKSILNGTIISDYKQDTSIVFIDMSIYNSTLPITDCTLQIITPYNINFKPINYNSNSITIITTKDINNSIDINQIPCGLYKIKQSICPNDKLFYEFWYVHVGGIKQKIAKLYCANKIKEALILSQKIDTLEALCYCRDDNSEKKILAMLNSIDCNIDSCTNQQPMSKLIIPKTCSCKKSNCLICN